MAHESQEFLTVITDQIRGLLKTHGRLAVDVDSFPEDGDLYSAGLTSHASVSLMLALEDCFAVEFPERLLRRGAFARISTIRAALLELTSPAS